MDKNGVVIKNKTRRSTLGGCQILKGKLVCWSGKKQISVAMSYAKAEYVAAASNQGSHDQLNATQQMIAYCLIFGLKVDIGSILFSYLFAKLLNTAKGHKDANICCIRKTPSAPEVSLTSYMLQVAKLSTKEPEKTLILSSDDVNANNTVDKSLSKTETFAKTQHAEEPVATGDTTKCLYASESTMEAVKSDVEYMLDDEILSISRDDNYKDDTDRELFVADEVVADNILDKIIIQVNKEDTHTNIFAATCIESLPEKFGDRMDLVVPKMVATALKERMPELLFDTLKNILPQLLTNSLVKIMDSTTPSTNVATEGEKESKSQTHPNNNDTQTIKVPTPTQGSCASQYSLIPPPTMADKEAKRLVDLKAKKAKSEKKLRMLTPVQLRAQEEELAEIKANWVQHINTMRDEYNYYINFMDDPLPSRSSIIGRDAEELSSSCRSCWISLTGDQGTIS
uniref:Retrovirus-related Pol polyprotein from transposon TNT 1-94 n=1 Tax=Tanacetum cinerariifolium TaxID=118510 RepID=A0A6L2KEE4_TANCI|nr:retrovirus-related Pol polyprotein from transposon TNT 1-94 [Tanacetum cinerariifolium]